jgi:hypothetical protein
VREVSLNRWRHASCFVGYPIPGKRRVPLSSAEKRQRRSESPQQRPQERDLDWRPPRQSQQEGEGGRKKRKQRWMSSVEEEREGRVW